MKLRALLVLATALTIVDAAAGAYVPRLFAGHVPNGVEVRFRQTEADDATASFAVYVPSSYASAHTAPPAGTMIGRVSARIQASAVGPGVVLTLDGTLVADSPLNHLSNSCSPGLHQAVWIASISVPGQQQIRLPVYVDSTAGAPDAALGAVRLYACLPSPNVPESQGGAALGAKVLEAAFTLERVFTPPGSGRLQWTGQFVPYLAGTRTPNVTGRVESRAFIRTPGRVTLRARRITRARRHFAVLSGAVTEAGLSVPGASVRITGGGRTRTVRTKGRSFSLTVPLRSTTTFRASANVPERDVTAVECATVPPCVSASAAGFQASSGRVKVTLTPRKPKR